VEAAIGTVELSRRAPVYRIALSSKENFMGEQKTPTPNRDQSSVGNRPGKQYPQQDRDSASRQPGKQFPDENQQPNERASTPPRDRDLDHDNAARRQARQDPLQKRDR
jgi:hypothetical protein